MTVNVEVHQHEISSHWALAVPAMIRGRVTAQKIARICIEAKDKVIFDGKAAARCSHFDGPIDVSPRVFRKCISIVQFSHTAAEVGIAENRFSRQESLEMEPILVAAI